MQGQTLRHYQLLEKVGEGGMGVVYKARDTRLNRLVAIKLLPPDKVADPQRRARFVQEAQAASSLSHPHIVVVYDIDAEGGQSFIAMEYVAGRNLDEMIPRNGMRLTDALKIAAQVADGLAKAHSAGIIHRDIKPSNIRVSDDSVAKILDFGLAKLTDPEEKSLSEEDVTRTERPRTEEGLLMGTAAYMSPEQVECRKLDSRSDIFSFGAMLYEMLTGRRAFAADSRAALLATILHKDPVPVGNLLPGLPSELQTLVARCLRKDPERRFQHIGDVKVALQELKEDADSGMQKAPAAARTRPWAGTAAVAGAVLALGAIAGFMVWRARDSGPRLEPSYEPLPFATHSGDERDPTFSPDGTQIAYSWGGDKNEGLNIYVKLIGSGAPIRLTKTPGDIEPQWSPDGKWIVFMRNEGKTSIVAIPALGGPERTLREPRAASVSWSPDSQWVVADNFNNGSIEAISLRTAETRPILARPGTGNAAGPTVSPDGRKMAFAVRQGQDAILYSVDLDKEFKASGKPLRLTPGPSAVISPAFTAEGKDVLYIDGSRETSSALWRVPADGSAPPRKLSWAGEYAWFLGVAARGNRMAFTRLNRDVNIKRWTMDATNSVNGEPWIPSTYIDDEPDFSPDGAKVAFHSFRGGSSAIWVANADGSSAAELTHFDGLHTNSPRWSPDGSRIAFSSRGDGSMPSGIYTVAADGLSLKRLSGNEAVDIRPSWSRDGKQIYFISNRSGRNELWRMPSTGGAAEQVTKSGADSGRESYDGQSVFALQRAAPGSPDRQIVRISKHDGSIQPLDLGSGDISSAGTTARYVPFVPGAQGLYLVAFQKQKRNWAVVLYPQRGDPRVVKTFDRGPGSGLAVSPDGKTILYAEQDTFGSDIFLVENFH